MCLAHLETFYTHPVWLAPRSVADEKYEAMHVPTGFFSGYFLFNALFAIGFNFSILRMGEDGSMAAYCIFASVLAF